MTVLIVHAISAIQVIMADCVLVVFLVNIKTLLDPLFARLAMVAHIPIPREQQRQTRAWAALLDHRRHLVVMPLAIVRVILDRVGQMVESVRFVLLVNTKT